MLFDERVPAVVRARMDYAFRVFAAVYGYEVVSGSHYEPVRSFLYGGLPSTQESISGHVRIPARYTVPRRVHNQTSSRLTKIRHSGEDFHLFHGLDPITRQPDWLGEIFEWLSGGWESRISARDSVGRIPDAEMIFSRSGVPPWKPQAALQMAWLDGYSRNRNRQDALLSRASSPVGDADHFVICSHDIDFYYTDRKSALIRLMKNLAISCLLYRSTSYLNDNLLMFFELLKGNRVGDYLPLLISRLEQLGCRSSFFVVPVHQHRRDPNYSLSELDVQLRHAAYHLFPVELHGSYTSILDNHSLAAEAQKLRAVTAKPPSGNRQHWLRFNDQQMLFRAVTDGGLLFDSSLGFTDTVGFRSGASFAFPPYNFETEKPYDFLEFPLAIMDGGLLELWRETGEPPQALADRVLAQSRKLGWGGISILWHNPIDALSVPAEINRVFWTCAAQRQHFREEWVSTTDFLELCLPRYQRAGLLTKHKPNTEPATRALSAAASAYNRRDSFPESASVSRHSKLSVP